MYHTFGALSTHYANKMVISHFASRFTGDYRVLNGGWQIICVWEICNFTGMLM